MNKKLLYVFVVLVGALSCNTARRTVTFQKEVGFQRSEGCFFAISDIDRLQNGSDYNQNKIIISNSQFYEEKDVIHWQGTTIGEDGRAIPFVNFHEYDSTGLHYLDKSDEHGSFCIETQNANCKGFFLDSDHVEITRGFALGEEEIYIKTHQAYVTSNCVCWKGKTMDKNGEELPYVSFYEIDSTKHDNIFNTAKYNNSFFAHFIGTSDEHGNFNVRSLSKSFQGFYLDCAGYLGTVMHLDSAFSPKYAALFEETYHAVDIDDGVFKIGEQTAMDEARAWQFAANAPGTKDFVKSKIDGTEGYTIAYTARVMSTGWVAKMLKEGQPNPTFQQHHPEWYQGEIEKYRGEVMNMAYPSLKEGSGYGLSYHENNLNLLANWSFALKDVKLSNPPESLIFGRDGLIHMKSNKEPYTGTVVGNIVCPYGKTGLKKRDFLFYEKFGSYDVLACNAAFYEMGMFRIAFGHYINVDGAISDGKEEGHWQYRYIYGDKDFLIVTANYKDGKLDGLAEFFKEDGRKYQECEFEKGVLKLRIWYNESGEIIYRDTYENGELKKTEQFAKDPRNF